MSAPTVIVITNGKLKLADTEAELTSGGEDFECQVTEAAINATPNLQTVPATFCEPESQSPAATGYELAVTWLQDWTAPGGGLSNYAFLNDTQKKWFSLTLEDGVQPIAIGEVRLVAGSFGGAAGTPLTATATWPLASKPTIGTPPPLLDVSGTYPLAAGEPDLVSLKADAVAGDLGSGIPYNGGVGTEPTFDPGEHITLGDSSLAHWDGAAWVVGAA
jgi:hypothetical protein